MRTEKKHDILCVAAEDETGRNFQANPDRGYQVKANDRLFIIAEERPEIS